MSDVQQRTIELFPKQDEFIFSDERFGAYGGGFGNGKTLAGIIKTYNHCQQPNAFFLIGRRHATDLRDSTLRDFLEHVGHTGTYRPGNMSFRFNSGGEVIFRHLDDMQSLTNMNLSGFWIDQAEEVAEAAFVFLAGRLRRPVQRREGFITYNMNGHDWIWRRFHKKLAQDGKPLPDAEDHHEVIASTLENQSNLPADYVKSLLSMGDEFIKRFVYGSYDTFAGQVYDEFMESVHVIDPFPIPDGWERVRGFDHGQNNPTAVGWAAIDYDGNVFVYDEYYKPNDVVSNHVRAINEQSVRQTELGEVKPETYAYNVSDPSMHAKTREKNGRKFSVADEYLEAGIALLPGQNDVIAGINRVKTYLRVDPNRIHPITGERGSPRLFFFRTCTYHIEEHQQYRWKQAIKLSGDPNSDDVKERPVKRQDHTVDEVRYIIMSRPPIATEEEQIEPWVLKDPLEMARRAKQLGVTVEELAYRNFKQGGVRRSQTKLVHREGGIEHRDEL